MMRFAIQQTGEGNVALQFEIAPQPKPAEQ